MWATAARCVSAPEAASCFPASRGHGSSEANSKWKKVLKHIMNVRIFKKTTLVDGGQRVWKSNVRGTKLTETFRKRRVCLQHSRKCSFFLYYSFQKIGQPHPCPNYLFWLNALPTYTHVWSQLFYLVSMQTINQGVDQIGGLCTCKRSLDVDLDVCPGCDLRTLTLSLTWLLVDFTMMELLCTS